MTTEKEKIELGNDTLATFFSQFGDDKHTEIFLECLLKEL